MIKDVPLQWGFRVQPIKCSINMHEIRTNFTSFMKSLRPLAELSESSPPCVIGLGGTFPTFGSTAFHEDNTITMECHIKYF